MAAADVEMTPEPVKLERQDAFYPPSDMTTRYLQYECNYNACKYKEPALTWGEMIKQDYSHFVWLMCNHVPLESNTFEALKEHLCLPDLKLAQSTKRQHDLPEAIEARTQRYLDLTCSHNGRMNGKKWREILKTDYDYFLWAVGNTMGRDTRTFNGFVECLTDKDKTMVLNTPKGKVKTKKHQKNVKNQIPAKK